MGVFKKIFKISSIRDIKSISTAMCILLLMYPLYTWNYFAIINFVALAFLFLGIFIEVFVYKKVSIKPYFWLYIVYYIYSNLTGISSKGSFFDIPVLIAICLLTFPMQSLKEIFQRFYYIFGVLLVISISFYLMKISGLYSPVLSGIIGPDQREYLSYPFNVLLTVEQVNPIYIAMGIYRFYGMLSEPGYVGTICALIICAKRFDFKGDSFLYIYLVAAILSLSLASYITLALGFLFTINMNRLIYFGIPILLFMVLQQDIADQFVFNRLKPSDGKVIQDNRTSKGFDEEWKSHINSLDLIWGKGKSQHTKNSSGGVSSWKSLVFNYGIIGLVLYLSILAAIFISIRPKDFYAYIVLLVVLLTIYHRPNVHLSEYLIIYIYGLLLAKERKLSQTRMRSGTFRDKLSLS